MYCFFDTCQTNNYKERDCFSRLTRAHYIVSVVAYTQTVLYRFSKTLYYYITLYHDCTVQHSLGHIGELTEQFGDHMHQQRIIKLVYGFCFFTFLSVYWKSDCYIFISYSASLFSFSGQYTQQRASKSRFNYATLHMQLHAFHFLVSPTIKVLSIQNIKIYLHTNLHFK